jgi:hypothetical protein
MMQSHQAQEIIELLRAILAALKPEPAKPAAKPAAKAKK